MKSCPVLLAAILLFSGVRADSQDKAVQERELAESLADSFLQWRNEVSVYATYTVRYGKAESKEKAFRNPCELTTVSAIGNGAFVQQKPMKRISVDFTGFTTVSAAIEADGTRKAPQFEKDGKIVVGPGDGIGVKWTSWDEVSNDSLRLEYSPAWKNTNDRAVFSRIGDGSSGVPADCLKWDQQITPLNPLRGCGHVPNRGTAFRDEPEFSSSSHDGLLIVNVKSHRESAQGRLTHVDTTTWETDQTLPLLVRWQRQTSSMNEVLMDLETRLTDFRQCGDYKVAAHVTNVNRSRSGAVNVVEWKSDDLGLREPIVEDFAIAIATTTIIRGLKDAPAPGTERSLTLGMFEESQTLKSGTIIPPGPGHGGKAPQPRSFSPLILANLFVIVVLAGLFLFRAYSKNTKSQN